MLLHISLFIVLCSGLTLGLNDADILKRFEEIERREAEASIQYKNIEHSLLGRLKGQTVEMDGLRATVAQQEARIAELEASLNGQQQGKAGGNVAASDHDKKETEEIKKGDAGISGRSASGKVRRLLPETPVAFSAFKQADQNNINKNEFITFEKVNVNEGNGYHSTHGLFTAPVSGTYFFSVTLLHPNQPQPTHVDIVHNGNVVARLHCEHTTWEQSTQSFLLNVNAGEDVFVRNIDLDNETFKGSLTSSFSGFLLWEF
ncbi:complement C1q tumor necrosis factor-related protein 3-like [Mya arenaria]|uniref:complement C1q tumor necrosis factor-related protein 3-like n=1 Tax=Mya arenaria TaxID=6604 RepID=UPI0022E15ACC|nr:complement C1q tumor necrosis factor-related protein 3-like [Mya arenaria]